MRSSINISFVIYFILLLILALLLCKSVKSQSENSELKGAITRIDQPELNFKKWISGNFQFEAEKFVAQNFSFSDDIIKMHNQWDYTIWGNLNVKGVVEGKDKYLFEQLYIDGVKGLNLDNKKNFLDRKKKAIVKIHQENKKRNHELIFVVMPSKGSFYPEKIKDLDVNETPDYHIYDYFLDFAKEKNLNVINFHEYFLKQKKMSEYPIFPKQGIHLSEYAESVVLDSLLKYIENIRGEDIYKYHFSEPELTTIPRNRDQDIGEPLNLMKPFPFDEILAYRHIQVERIKTEMVPNVLVIGDSFYWGLYSIINNLGLFGKHQFWYRNHNIFPAEGKHLRQSNDQTCLHSLDNFDMTLIIINSNDMEWSGWGYFKNTARILNGSDPGIDLERVEYYIKKIYKNTTLLKQVKEKAIERGISLDSMVYLDAKWFFENEQ